jgi:sugar O-acyltransferase (sialic acid O-acetyltransferase NeuD family)
MQKVIVFGNRTLAEVMHYYLTHDSPYEVAAFTVDAERIACDTLVGLPVIPFERVAEIYPPAGHRMLVSVGYQKMNRLRAERYRQAKTMGYECINYISSKAAAWTPLAIGENCIIQENSVIQPYVEVGNNIFIGPQVVLGHHTVIGDHSFIAPGAVILGEVTIEPYSLIGANATVKEGVTVARECLIGMGVSITRNTRPKEVYVNKSPRLLPKASDQLSTWLTYTRSLDQSL